MVFTRAMSRRSREFSSGLRLSHIHLNQFEELVARSRPMAKLDVGRLGFSGFILSLSGALSRAS
jgi:hypothetical protein